MRGLLRRIASRADQSTAALRAEVVLLRDENTRLRLERQRLLGAADSAERIRALMRAAQGDGDQADDAVQALADTIALREALRRVVTEVQQAMNVAQQQLADGTPPTELDRRTGERRRSAQPDHADADPGSPVRHLRAVDGASPDSRDPDGHRFDHSL